MLIHFIFRVILQVRWFFDVSVFVVRCKSNSSECCQYMCLACRFYSVFPGIKFHIR